MKALLIIFILSLAVGDFGSVGPVLADIYRYQDETGVVFFTNVPTNSNYQLFYREALKGQATVPFKDYRKALYVKSQKFYKTPLLANHIDAASQYYGIDPKLIQAVIHVESNFNPQAISPKGAQGLMQLMPQTARDLQVFDPFSPRDNIVGGARYLRYLLDLYQQDMTLALAAYNAGPEKVNLYRGIPPYLETRTYVQKVMQIYSRLKDQILSTH
ncbi:MAG: lytic transglycosylase [Desulfobacca sp.]|nr:lytic transglycosylase [Desulfobacca sp.]